jgi:sugar phosphate isomerase/epimerase
MMKVSLYTVSFTAAWYNGPALSLEEVLKRAKAMGYAGVEIGAKRPHASPMDLEAKARERIRKQADALGLEIPAVAGYSNFASPILEQRENELLMAREQVKLARDLGVPLLRVFAAWRGITLRDGRATYEMTRRYWQTAFPEVIALEQWRWCKECLRELADFAGEMGVTLALQNHEPLIRGYEDVLDMVREVNSPALQACIDAPLLHQQDDASVQKAVWDTGERQVHTHFGGEFEEVNGEAVQREIRFSRRGLINYPAFIAAMKGIGYTGHIAYEFCHPCLNEQHELEGLAEVERQVELACRYMTTLIARTPARPSA